MDALPVTPSDSVQNTIYRIAARVQLGLEVSEMVADTDILELSGYLQAEAVRDIAFVVLSAGHQLDHCRTGGRSRPPAWFVQRAPAPCPAVPSPDNH